MVHDHGPGSSSGRRRDGDLGKLGDDAFEAEDFTGRAPGGCRLVACPEEGGAKPLFAGLGSRSHSIGVGMHAFDDAVRSETVQLLASHAGDDGVTTSEDAERTRTELRQQRDGRNFWHSIPPQGTHGQKVAGGRGEERGSKKATPVVAGSVKRGQDRRVELTVTDPERIPAARYYDPGLLRPRVRASLAAHVADGVPARGDPRSRRLRRIPASSTSRSSSSASTPTPSRRTSTHAATARTKLVDDRGNCERSGFICPFHGWCWNLDGTNSFVYQPELFSEAALDPDDLRLVECQVDTWAGCVFVNMDRDAPPLRRVAREPSARSSTRSTSGTCARRGGSRRSFPPTGSSRWRRSSRATTSCRRIRS